MQDFHFIYPVEVCFGNGAFEKDLPRLLEKTGDNILFAYGQGSIFKTGLYDRVKEILEKAGKNVIEFGGIMPNPTYEKVQEGAKLIKDNNVDFVLAVGGGSVIDCSKAAATQAEMEDDLWQALFEKKVKPQSSVPVGAVVSASGTGSEMNEICVITNQKEGTKRGMRNIAPVFAILDPQLTRTVPISQVFSGAFDTFSHAVESLMGNSDKDNPSDDLALAVMKNTVVNMRRLIENPDDLQARGNLMWDSAMAENGILKCGRDLDFQVHQMEHQVAVETDINHGQGLAVILPAYYRYIQKDIEDKLLRMAKEVFEVQTVEEGLVQLEKLITDCGIPSRFSELKSTKPITEEVLKTAASTCRIIETTPADLTHEDLYQIMLSRI